MFWLQVSLFLSGDSLLLCTIIFTSKVSLLLRHLADFPLIPSPLCLPQASVRRDRTLIDDQNRHAIKNSIVNRKQMWRYSLLLQLLQAGIPVRFISDWRSRRSMAMEKERSVMRGRNRNRARSQHSANLLHLALKHRPISFDELKALPSGKSDSEVVFSRSPADGETTITRESLCCRFRVFCAVAYPFFRSHLHLAHC
jgi:hypothetical protein